MITHIWIVVPDDTDVGECEEDVENGPEKEVPDLEVSHTDHNLDLRHRPKEEVRKETPDTLFHPCSSVLSPVLPPSGLRKRFEKTRSYETCERERVPPE